MADSRFTVNSVERALTLLDALCASGGLSIQDAAELLGIHRSSAYRLLETLRRQGYALKNDRAARYEPGLRVELLSERRMNPILLSAMVRPILRQAAEATGEDVHLCMLTRHGMVFVEKEFSNSLIRINRPAHVCEPIHCTASGKAVLAFLPEAHREWLLGQCDLKRYTSKTITDMELLRRELDKAARAGYATDESELYEEVYCAAVPVFDRADWPYYSLGISWPARMVDPEKLDKAVPLLKQGAERIGRQLRKGSAGPPAACKPED